MLWAEIRIKTTPQAHEAIASTLLEAGCNGVAIAEDPITQVIGYLPADDTLDTRIARLRSRLEELEHFGIQTGPAQLEINEIQEESWEEVWKQIFKPIRVGRRLVIKPVWEDYQASSSDIVIQLEIGMAFGTGMHASTRLCLRALEEQVRPNQTVVDFGTGSGILAIAAAHLGAGLVIAFDSDELAVQAARRNVVLNELEHAIEVHRADSPRFITNICADIVAANITGACIAEHANDVAQVLKDRGILIASGFTPNVLQEVEDALHDAGLRVIEKAEEESWVMLTASHSL